MDWGFRSYPSLNPQLSTLRSSATEDGSTFNPLRDFIGRWFGGIAMRIPGSLQAYAGRQEQPAAPKTNIGLAAKEDSGWGVEGGQARLRGGCLIGRGHA